MVLLLNSYYDHILGIFALLKNHMWNVKKKKNDIGNKHIDWQCSEGQGVVSLGEKVKGLQKILRDTGDRTVTITGQRGGEVRWGVNSDRGD